MELKLYIQQAPQFNINNQQVHYAGNGPQSLNVVTGGLPQSRQWPKYNNWIDVTEDVGNLYKLKLTWTNDRDAEGLPTPGEFHAKKAASGILNFEGGAYKLIKQWLVDDVSAPLNSVLVKIVHKGCKDGEYNQFSFKGTDVRWCDDGVCTFELSLTQRDDALDCIRKTMIADNYRHWFDETPLNKQHPRFSYCNEQRPNGIMVMIWFVTSILIVTTFPMIGLAVIGLNGVFLIINSIINTINFIINIVGGNSLSNTPVKPIPLIDPKDILENFSQFYIDSAGCGREHPAPLVRDYIQNVCDKCGITVDGTTAPVFFAQQMSVETSSRGVIQVHNPHYNACYLHATVERGVRRFNNLNPLFPMANTTTFYLPDNAPQHTLDEFLDELKTLYNAEWRIQNNKLYFQRKDFFVDPNPVLDLAKNGVDRLNLLEGVCYEWNEKKFPSYVEGLYSQDPVDTCGNEAHKHMNDLWSYGDVVQNPNFDEKRQDKLAQYGATKFRLDGASDDYVYDALQVVVNSSILNPFMAGLMFDNFGDAIQTYADYALLMKDETSALPKILLWDGESYLNAKCVRPFSAESIANYQMPHINGLYNNKSETWNQQHPPYTFVRGQGLTLPPFHKGYYTVTDFFGAREIKKPALLVNYPMYMAIGYEDSMWDWFHWIDDPNRNPKLNMNFTARLELCCDMLDKMKVFGDGSGVVLAHKVKLPNKYFADGRIKEIEVSYDTQNETGQYIQVKGEL